jgi:Uma2 family endonuclease
MSTGLLQTIDDLEQMPDDDNRYELLEGEIVVSHAPTLSHQRISMNITAIMLRYLEQNPTGEVFATPGVIFDQHNAVIPDLVWVSYARQTAIVERDRFIAAPDLLIEIVSPGESNARRDRTTKREVYGRFGVEEYWIVEPERQAVDRYTLVDTVLELQQTATSDDDLQSDVLPGFVCRVADIFRR